MCVYIYIYIHTHISIHAMNIKVHMSLIFCFYLCLFLENTQEWNCQSIGSSIFNFGGELSYCFPQELHQFTFSPIELKGSLFSASSLALVIVLIIAILTGVRWCFIVVLICVSLTITELNILSCAFWLQSLLMSSAHFFKLSCLFF